MMKVSITIDGTIVPQPKTRWQVMYFRCRYICFTVGDSAEHKHFSKTHRKQHIAILAQYRILNAMSRKKLIKHSIKINNGTK